MFFKQKTTQQSMSFFRKILILVSGINFLSLFKFLVFYQKVLRDNRDGFVALLTKFEESCRHYLYFSFRDSFQCVVVSAPGATLTHKERKFKENQVLGELSGRQDEFINMASYNYLGFAMNNGMGSENSIKSIEKYGIATCSSRWEMGECSEAM